MTTINSTKTIKALVVDDEVLLSSTIISILKEFCPSVEVVGHAQDAFEALLKINETEPDLVFLDIEMPFVNGIDFLKSIGKRTFQVVLVTAHGHYALEGLKAGALDYILKPVSSDSIIKAIDKMQRFIAETKPKKRALPAEPVVKNQQALSRIVVPQNGEVLFINIEEIVLLRADRNYTQITLLNGKRILTAKLISYFEDLLPNDTFFRVHKSSIVNMNHITKFGHDESGYMVMLKNSIEVRISQLKRSEFRQVMLSRTH